ncbi:probable LRR receptor-like serine/threonine-protein kinase At3g47570 [Jatropha curcas]|uniref:probable LRR receptor-like serine/threonine-protein kinase At3g47570 n=1 Tax=Jatropha curcas TaxID=180498 RepID=UPI0018930DF3|nr:probable LRR receptor-like serine/threonine-protein kinase At3g47570 [Jatropha curcas]
MGVSWQKAKSFMAECEALRNIRHRNLVKIITACSGVDNQGNDFMALVYEFTVHGSLEKWLHPSLAAVNGMQERYMFLNLIQRINIAIDVAFAIEYLHHRSGTPIVHCDLKPSNVLLDDEMTAHIGDFGLAKFLSHSIQNNFSNQSSSAGLRGTIGYAPPEYGLGSEVSTQGDVYSYGILLLEMFTRKRPTADMFKEGLNLHKFVESALPNEVSAIADPFLFQEGGQSNERTMIECLISILGIGVSCSAELSRERMDITDAAIELCLIRDK